MQDSWLINTRTLNNQVGFVLLVISMRRGRRSLLLGGCLFRLSMVVKEVVVEDTIQKKRPRHDSDFFSCVSFKKNLNFFC